MVMPTTSTASIRALGIQTRWRPLWTEERRPRCARDDDHDHLEYRPGRPVTVCVSSGSSIDLKASLILSNREVYSTGLIEIGFAMTAAAHSAFRLEGVE
jgi:hypothetical protein